MLAVSYQREKQFHPGEIENHIGIFDEIASSKYNGYVNIYHPIIDGTIWFGVCHTNAENIQEIELDYPVKNSMTGEIYGK